MPGVMPNPNGKPPGFAGAGFGWLAEACDSPMFIALADGLAPVPSVFGARMTKCSVTPSFTSSQSENEAPTNESLRRLTVFFEIFIVFENFTRVNQTDLF